MELSTRSLHPQVDAVPTHEGASGALEVSRKKNIAGQGERAASSWMTVISLLLTDLTALLVIGGMASILFSLVAGYLPTVPTVLLAISVLVVAFGVHGLYGSIHRHPAEEMRLMSMVTTVVLGGAAVTSFFLMEAVAAILIAGLTLVAAVIIPAVRVFARITFSKFSWWGMPAVVLGTDKGAKTVVNTLERWPELGLRPFTLPGDHYKKKAKLAVGGLRKVLDLAQKKRVTCAVVIMSDFPYQDRSHLLAHLGKFYQRLIVIPHGTELHTLWTTRAFFHGLFAQGIQHSYFKPVARGIKRTIDVIVAGVGLLLFLPLIVVVSVLIKLDSKGPVFFKQQRMTRQGRCFKVYKFRTMHADAEERLERILSTDPQRREEYDKYHKLTDDPRVTSVGAWLRRTSLDEFPQLWNVFRGQMSLVGPRAYIPGELFKMNGLSRIILQSPPGITGLWQVSGRNKLDFETRTNLDVHYTQNWTIWLDLYILVRTIPVVFSGEGAK